LLFEELEKINKRPEPFEFYTAGDLWTDEHTSKEMLAFHLNPEIDVSSRKASFIDRSVDWIAAYFHVRAGTKIADFGCGPGLYTSRLAQKGAEVTGIDFSKRSIQYAQEAAIREGLSINYRNQNYLDFETDDRFQLIMMIMCDFCALSPGQRDKMLAKFHEFLEPEGCVLLDVYSMNAFEQRQEAAAFEANMLNGFWSPNRYYGFQNTFKYESEKVVLDKYSIFEADRKRVVYNWLQYFSPEDLKSELEVHEFSIEGIFSDVAGSPFDPQANEFAVAAKKS
jgi:2-polyprenyl-3-methyl-5-hydroxy-6-metoxy-1,4-benzoquinol methylase